MEVKADKGILLADPKILKHTTLGAILTKYRDTVSPKKRSHETERLVLCAFLLHPVCRRRLAELRPEDFAAYRDERLREVKPGTVRRQLAIIRHAIELARAEWGIPLQQNPLAKLQINGVDQRRERRLRLGEEEQIIKAAESARNPFVRSIIRLALATGMRRGEILAITADHVDCTARSLLIPETKNGHARTIPLTNEAIALLHSCKTAPGGRLFPVTANAFRLAWQRVKQRAGVIDLRFHDLRHEAISRFFERGLTAPEVALISGHRDIRMLFRYSHPLRENILSKLDKREGTNGPTNL
jgi:integrase